MYNRFTNDLTVMGHVISMNVATASIQVRARSGDVFEAFIGPQTWFYVLTNLDETSHDWWRNQPGPANVGDALARYVRMGDLILVDGIQLQDAGRVRFDCRTLNILHGPDGELLFESPYWWIHQITRQCDALIADMWRDSDDFEYTRYRTNIGIFRTAVA